jgi:DNA polymerase III subunit epsilon
VYAVIDLETTGLNPWRHDRIAEIAIVHVDADGTITDEWCTLVNPQRDLGPQRIHGIRAADARRAPTFAQLAPQIAALLQGRLLVAHNAAFDAPFLAHQFRQIGQPVPISRESRLCTMELAREFLPDSGRSLAACCATAGVPLENAHSALDDTRAAALLLGYYLRSAPTPPPWADQLADATQRPWPAMHNPNLPEVRRRTVDATEEHFLSRLVDRLPRVHAPVQADAYLALLDWALVDHRISATESDALVAAATGLHLGLAEVIELHNGYLAAIAAAALADGALTDPERHELDQVATLLGLPSSSIDTALANAHGVRVPRQRFVLAAGDTVVFTGDSVPPREELERIALDAGLTVGDLLTPETRLLVAADVDTMSVKARKAMTYGVPVVDLATFMEMVQAVPQNAAMRDGAD